jgi:hypothetical protein
MDKVTKMNNESFKQNPVDVARGYVDSLFCLGVCGNQFSPKLRFCGTAIIDGHSSDVDNDTIQRHPRIIEECRQSNSEMSSSTSS